MLTPDPSSQLVVGGGGGGAGVGVGRALVTGVGVGTAVGAGVAAAVGVGRAVDVGVPVAGCVVLLGATKATGLLAPMVADCGNTPAAPSRPQAMTPIIAPELAARPARRP